MRPQPEQSDALPSIVLFVDTDETTLASYSAHFQSAGVWVAISTNPLEAIEAVRELRPDLVVTTTFDDEDVDLVTALKSGTVTLPVPVILLAARPDRHAAAARLADLCLQAPVPASVLLSCSEELIARSREARNQNEQLHQQAPQLVVMSDAPAKENSPQTMRRPCPGCGKPLEWIEQGRLNGVDYDYYRWCTSGCGLYCYERRAATWIKLA